MVTPIIKCKDCEFFSKGRSHLVIYRGIADDDKEGECFVLLSMLRLHNATLIHTPTVYISETFGCAMGKLSAPEKNHEKKTNSERSKKKEAKSWKDADFEAWTYARGRK